MAAEHQIRIAFVIAEKDIVFRRQGFDEVVFENQRFGFGTRDGGFDMVNLFYHQCDARRMVVFLEIAGNAPLEIDRFADIQNIVVFVKKTVHAPEDWAGFSGKEVNRTVRLRSRDFLLE